MIIHDVEGLKAALFRDLEEFHGCRPEWFKVRMGRVIDSFVIEEPLTVARIVRAEVVEQGGLMTPEEVEQAIETARRYSDAL